MYLFYRLKYLNLDNNEIYSIPQLKLLGSNQPQTLTPLPDIQHTPTASERESALDNHEISQQNSKVADLKNDQESDKSPSIDESTETVAENLTEKLVTDDEKAKDLNNSKKAEKAQSLKDNEPRASIDQTMQQEPSDEVFTSKTDIEMLEQLSAAPFPELDTLSLVNNLVRLARVSCMTRV